MKNKIIRLIRPFYYSDSQKDQIKIMKIKGCKLVEIKGEKHLGIPLSNDQLIFIPAEGLIQT